MLDKQKQLQANIFHLLERGKKRVDQIEISATIETGFSVDVRLGDVETLEHHRKNSMDITVYHQQRTGNACTSDLSLEAMERAFEKASAMTQFTQEDPCAGLADANQMARDYPDLVLSHPWNITPKQAISLAIECETLARNHDPRIKQSEGANLSTYRIFNIYGNSHGFLGYYPSTWHTLGCELIAEQDRFMQRDHDYTLARDPKKLSSIETIAIQTAEKTIRRLGARRLSTRQCPVIFNAPVARSVLRSFISAISGSNLYRGTSFLQNQLHQQIFPEFVSIYQDPHLPGEIGSTPFDESGVKTRKINFVENGVLTHYVLGTYSAKKLAMETTGNSGGVYNLFITTGDKNLTGLLKEMQCGLLVTELMGQGVNLITGNYSRGAFGFWIENGEIQYPVEEITIAGNLKDMFKQIQLIGNDIDPRGNIKTGSILIEQMTVAGE
ncbi:metalloprotease PmbA [Coxiella burnetii]|uniref:metalloprotease PmbA n=1 Tax=Coxiella burnetii TaxID=777 RepID=UPI000CCC9711|nr:metalloprotease PmbA [Coxiella burnetii]PNT87031.1 metalloprotease PmbA [Coxiella burnetii]